VLLRCRIRAALWQVISTVVDPNLSSWRRSISREAKSDFVGHRAIGFAPSACGNFANFDDDKFDASSDVASPREPESLERTEDRHEALDTQEPGVGAAQVSVNAGPGGFDGLDPARNADAVVNASAASPVGNDDGVALNGRSDAAAGVTTEGGIDLAEEDVVDPEAAGIWAHDEPFVDSVAGTLHFLAPECLEH